jgi:hypothetical protein
VKNENHVQLMQVPHAKRNGLAKPRCEGTPESRFGGSWPEGWHGFTLPGTSLSQISVTDHGNGGGVRFGEGSGTRFSSSIHAPRAFGAATPSASWAWMEELNLVPLPSPIPAAVHRRIG